MKISRVINVQNRRSAKRKTGESFIVAIPKAARGETFPLALRAPYKLSSHSLASGEAASRVLIIFKHYLASVAAASHV